MFMGEEEMLQVELVKKEPNKKKEEVDARRILDKLLLFFDNDIDEVIKFILLDQTPVHFITPGKRIDLHPTREYLLRLARLIPEIEIKKKALDNDQNELENFW